MRIQPESLEMAKNIIGLILDQSEVDNYLNIETLILAFKNNNFTWQMVDAVGVYSFVIWSNGKTEDEKNVLQDIFDNAIEPLESTIDSLVIGVSDERKNEKTRLLFHCRYALGQLLLVKSALQFKSGLENYGDGIISKKRATSLLHDMASTKLSVKWINDSRLEARSGPDIVEYFPEMGRIKMVSALFLPMSFLSEGDTKSYGEAIFLISESMPYLSSGFESTLILQGERLLNIWCSELKRKNVSNDDIQVEWLELLASSAALLEVAKLDESDKSNIDRPNLCKKESAQYLAWEFGQYIAQNFKSIESAGWHTIYQSFIWEAWYDNHSHIRSNQELWDTALTVFALIGDNPEWFQMGESAYEMWHNVNFNSGLPLTEITPDTDLYWAIKMSISDAMLKEGKTKTLPAPLIEKDLEDIFKKQSSYTPVMGKLETNLNKDEIIDRLRKHLGEIYDKLPGEIIEPLVEGEINYLSSTMNPNRGIFDFHEAVMKCLKIYLLKPMDKIVGKRRVKRLPSELSPNEWGWILKNFAQSKPESFEYSPYVSIFSDYCKQKGIKVDVKNLLSIGSKLNEIGSQRNKAKVGELRPRAEEKESLSRVRDLVLGINTELGIIVEIVKIF